MILTESAHKLGENGDKMQGKRVDFEVFFTQEAIGQSDDKIYGVTENVIYCYKEALYDTSYGARKPNLRSCTLVKTDCY